MNLKSKSRVTKPLATIISLVSIAILSVVFQGCNDDYEDISQASLTTVTANLKQLEEKYHVKIENTNNLNLGVDELLLIEDEIISLKSKFSNESCENVPLKKIETNRLKSGGLETVSVSAWAFNLSWMHVSVGINNDISINIKSWLTGVTIYSYQQQNLSHNFSPGNGQQQVSFNFTAVCTVSVAELLGVNITCNGDVIGSVNFADRTGSLYVDGY